MNIIEQLSLRGLIKDSSSFETLKQKFATPQTIYCGFDPSASSMHIGNFVMISILMRLQQAGHKVIAVVGGGTGMIGDPGGRSKERNLLDHQQLMENTMQIKAQLERFIDLSDPEKGLLVNNYDWLSTISMIDFLRDYGKHFSINYMLSKDVVASRLEGGISYTEFSYMILQSIDFLHLLKTYDCHFQIGGSDQWGNLTAGLELIRRVLGEHVFAEIFTAPLITSSSGRKFGKSEEGALYLNPKLTSAYKLYQYFINTPDADVINYLKIFTFLSLKEIEEIEQVHNQAMHLRLAQKKLAYDIVTTIHGLKAADEAVSMSELLFSGHIEQLSEAQIIDALGSLMVPVSEAIDLTSLLVTLNAASSKREAREFIKNRSIAVNGVIITDENKVINKEDSLFGYTIIRRGKKNYYLAQHQ